MMLGVRSTSFFDLLGMKWFAVCLFKAPSLFVEFLIQPKAAFKVAMELTIVNRPDYSR